MPSCSSPGWASEDGVWQSPFWCLTTAYTAQFKMDNPCAANPSPSTHTLHAKKGKVPVVSKAHLAGPPAVSAASFTACKGRQAWSPHQSGSHRMTISLPQAVWLVVKVSRAVQMTCHMWRWKVRHPTRPGRSFKVLQAMCVCTACMIN